MNKMKFYHSFYVIRNVNEKFQEARKIKISNCEFVYWHRIIKHNLKRQNKDRSIDYSLYIEQFIQKSFYPKNFL